MRAASHRARLTRREASDIAGGRAPDGETVIGIEYGEHLLPVIHGESGKGFLTGAQAAIMSRKSRSSVSEALSRLVSHGVIDEGRQVKVGATTSRNGKRYETRHFDLDTIMALAAKLDSAEPSVRRRPSAAPYRPGPVGPGVEGLAAKIHEHGSSINHRNSSKFSNWRDDFLGLAAEGGLLFLRRPHPGTDRSRPVGWRGSHEMGPRDPEPVSFCAEPINRAPSSDPEGARGAAGAA